MFVHFRFAQESKGSSPIIGRGANSLIEEFKVKRSIITPDEYPQLMSIICEYETTFNERNQVLRFQ